MCVPGHVLGAERLEAKVCFRHLEDNVSAISVGYGAPT